VFFDDQVDHLERQRKRVVMAAVLVEVSVAMAEVVEGSGVEQDAGAMRQRSAPGAFTVWLRRVQPAEQWFVPFLLHV